MNINDIKVLLEVIDVKAQSRINENPEDANLRRFKDKWLFILTLFVILCSFIGWIIFIILRPDSPQLNIVINGGFGLLMALVGYYVRGKS